MCIVYNMASKQLESIIATMPPATVREKVENFSKEINLPINGKDKSVKIVASATQSIKDELKELAKESGVTETIIILKALKDFGFKSIDESMFVDKRKLR